MGLSAASLWGKRRDLGRPLTPRPDTQPSPTEPQLCTRPARSNYNSRHAPRTAAALS